RTVATAGARSTAIATGESSEDRRSPESVTARFAIGRLGSSTIAATAGEREDRGCQVVLVLLHCSQARKLAVYIRQPDGCGRNHPAHLDGAGMGKPGRNDQSQ